MCKVASNKLEKYLIEETKAGIIVTGSNDSLSFGANLKRRYHFYLAAFTTER